MRRLTFLCGHRLPPKRLLTIESIRRLSGELCPRCRTRRLVERQEANHQRLTPETIKAGSAAYLSLFPEED